MEQCSATMSMVQTNMESLSNAYIESQQRLSQMQETQQEMSQKLAAAEAEIQSLKNRFKTAMSALSPGIAPDGGDDSSDSDEILGVLSSVAQSKTKQ